MIERTPPDYPLVTIRGMIKIYDGWLSKATPPKLKYVKIPSTEKDKLWLIPCNTCTPAHNLFKIDRSTIVTADIKIDDIKHFALPFELIDGDRITSTRPERGSTGDLFREVGVDIRNTFLTFGILSTTPHHFDKIDPENTVYVDPMPIVGNISRIQKLAESFASHYKGRICHYAVISANGLDLGSQRKGEAECLQNEKKDS